MGLRRGTDGWEPVRPDPLTQVDRRREIRPARSSGVVASGTLACPACDAPVGLGEDRLPLVAAVECSFCRRRGPLREFLSLAMPARPAHVVVRISPPAISHR